MRNTFIFAALATAFVADATAAAQACPAAIDQTQLTLDYAAFDAAGWRDLLMQGCADAAIAQLEAYRGANTATMTPDQSRELSFHIGQTLAFSGRDSESIPPFEAARGGEEEWAAYVDATLAFLRHDGADLCAQRARYALAPGASAMRISVIDGFIACADAPYAQAVHCALQNSH